jgi:hypothetical protein
MIKPISPAEAKEQIIQNFPDFVIQAVNNCINKNYFNKGSFSIKQEEIITEILNVAPEGTTRGEIFEKHWLDFEPIYRKEGWSIQYDSPAFNENYDAFYKFKV